MREVNTGRHRDCDPLLWKWICSLIWQRCLCVTGAARRSLKIQNPQPEILRVVIRPPAAKPKNKKNISYISSTIMRNDRNATPRLCRTCLIFFFAHTPIELVRAVASRRAADNSIARPLSAASLPRKAMGEKSFRVSETRVTSERVFVFVCPRSHNPTHFF